MTASSASGSAGARVLRSAAVLDVRVVLEAAAVIVFTWIVLGWTPAVTITQYDGSTLVAPYFQTALAGGVDWTHDLYRFGVIGGSNWDGAFSANERPKRVLRQLAVSLASSSTGKL